MRTAQKNLIIAISTALMTTGALHAQVKDPANASPTTPSTSAPLGAAGLPGQTCTGSSGASGYTCQPTIPTSGPADSRFDVEGCAAGEIFDVDIGLDVSHTWVGDLVFTVTSPDATAVTIISHPGNNCTGDNIFAVLDDEAATAVQSQCAGTPAIDGTFFPANPLSAFDGETGTGTWWLHIDDTVGGDSGALNDWSVDLTCRGDPTVSRTTFEVTKDFTDDNPGDVEVTLNCFTGLPLTQSQFISEGQGVEFVVTDFDDGELDCEITESEADVTGYQAEYNAGGALSTESCGFADVEFGYVNECTITNSPIPQAVEVDKDWIIEGSSGDDLDPGYRLRLVCDNEIVEGYEGSTTWSKTLYDSDINGTENSSYTASVVPNWDGGTQCWVEEDVFDSAVEVNNDCENLLVEIGSGDSCTITNTVFYEGIPTLSNYGLALMTLMMLGLGFVGFRRFA